MAFTGYIVPKCRQFLHILYYEPKFEYFFFSVFFFVLFLATYCHTFIHFSKSNSGETPLIAQYANKWDNQDFYLYSLHPCVSINSTQHV